MWMLIYDKTIFQIRHLKLLAHQSSIYLPAQTPHEKQHSRL